MKFDGGIHGGGPQSIAASLVFLGFESLVGQDWPTASRQNVDDAKVQLLLAARAKARAAKDWAEADRIRDELVAMGVVLMDRPDGTTDWEVAR
jgi:cysteinyl-tRNA synthetase